MQKYKYGFKIKCPRYNDYIETNDVSFIIDCINKLSSNEVIYIYDMDTCERFVVEIYDKKYALSMMNYYRDFEKDELIEFLSHGFMVFKEIRNNPEKQGFVWEDDGGL